MKPHGVAPAERPGTGAPPPVRVIGIGRTERGDDAAGRLVARRLRDDPPPGVGVSECAGEFATLLDLWDGAAAVIVVDALQAGVAPGTLLRVDALTQPLPVPASASTHGFGLAQAVEIARALHRLPQVLIVHGVEARGVEVLAGVSPEVADALEALTAAVRAEAALLAASLSSASR